MVALYFTKFVRTMNLDVIILKKLPDHRVFFLNFAEEGLLSEDAKYVRALWAYHFSLHVRKSILYTYLEILKLGDFSQEIVSSYNENIQMDYVFTLC